MIFRCTALGILYDRPGEPFEFYEEYSGHEVVDVLAGALAKAVATLAMRGVPACRHSLRMLTIELEVIECPA